MVKEMIPKKIKLTLVLDKDEAKGLPAPEKVVADVNENSQFENMVRILLEKGGMDKGCRFRIRL